MSTQTTVRQKQTVLRSQRFNTCQQSAETCFKHTIEMQKNTARKRKKHTHDKWEVRIVQHTVFVALGFVRVLECVSV